MGCTAAKNLTIEQLDGTKVTKLSPQENQAETRKVSIPRRVSDVPPLIGEEPQTELLESVTVNNIQKTQNGLSFDIAFEEEENQSIIKKHPPKRFRGLEEQQLTTSVSLDRLQEKMDEAEIRRQQILQQRMQSAQQRKAIKKQSSVASMNTEIGDMDFLQVPDDKPNTPFNNRTSA